jgi:DNA polymerase-3 subunit delta
MKIDKSALTAALKNWPAVYRAAVLYGPDDALVRERADIISRQIVADLRDPFNVIELTGTEIKDDPARLADEAAAMSMMGGRRLIRIFGDDVQDALTATLAMPSADAMIVVLAGDLKKDNKLRKWAEAAPDVAAIVCYVADVRDLAAMLREEAREAGYTLEDEATNLILAASGQERDVARRELEKTLLYVGGDSRTISASDVLAISANRGAADFNGLIQALMSDDGPAADAQIVRLADENIGGVAQMNAVSKRLWMMLSAHAHVQEGGSLEDFSRRSFGPMAWKEAPMFSAQLKRWPEQRVQRALARLLAADRAAKLSGAKDQDVIAGQALLGLVRGR